MNLLIVGGGGREHALAWKLSRSPGVGKIYCAPGNAGTARLGENVPLAITDADGLLALAREKRIDLTVIGPDDALAAGLADRFQAEGRRVFGPTRAAARLEWSKIFTKEFLQRHGIPTAAAGRFEHSADARRSARNAITRSSSRPTGWPPARGSSSRKRPPRRTPPSTP